MSFDLLLARKNYALLKEQGTKIIEDIFNILTKLEVQNIKSEEGDQIDFAIFNGLFRIYLEFEFSGKQGEIDRGYLSLFIVKKNGLVEEELKLKEYWFDKAGDIQMGTNFMNYFFDAVFDALLSLKRIR